MTRTLRISHSIIELVHLDWSAHIGRAEHFTLLLNTKKSAHKKGRSMSDLFL